MFAVFFANCLFPIALSNIQMEKLAAIRRSAYLSIRVMVKTNMETNIPHFSISRRTADGQVNPDRRSASSGTRKARRADAWNTANLRRELPRPPEEHVIQGAGHFDFLPPCTAALAQQAPQICASAPGFDRAAFHRELNAEVTKFFLKTLGNGYQ